MELYILFAFSCENVPLEIVVVDWPIQWGLFQEKSGATVLNFPIFLEVAEYVPRNQCLGEKMFFVYKKTCFYRVCTTP